MSTPVPPTPPAVPPSNVNTEISSITLTSGRILTCSVESHIRNDPSLPPSYALRIQSTHARGGSVVKIPLGALRILREALKQIDERWPQWADSTELKQMEKKR